MLFPKAGLFYAFDDVAARALKKRAPRVQF
jgi:hypothetical protein